MNPSDDPRLCWLFVDTTGVDFMRDELIGVACKRGPDELYAQFQPERLPSKELAQINGYDPDLWESWDRKSTLQCVADMIDGAVIAGHSLIFHSLFVGRAFKMHGIYEPRSPSFGRVSLESIFAPLKMIGLVEGLSMNELCSSLGVQVEGLGAWSQLQRAIRLYDEYFSALGLPT